MGFDVEGFSVPQPFAIFLFFGIACTDESFPPNSTLMRGKDEGNLFVMSIE